MIPQSVIKVAITLTVVAQALLSIPSADATCRPSGKYVNGKAVLNCTGGSSCCRRTGQTKKVRGVRYRVMDCSRCR